ncbi:uncharacterized protein LOC116801708 [Drosophila sechellia]|uniref:uncharacterized protein LOC116801708 n=1 Tax=Drosophila sechellia TaxID=7238 RepID=UPI0013DDD404|nr:uncharacterized protein LOC116801708 [Drosophila sechellia]
MIQMKIVGPVKSTTNFLSEHNNNVAHTVHCIRKTAVLHITPRVLCALKTPARTEGFSRLKHRFCEPAAQHSDADSGSGRAGAALRQKDEVRGKSVKKMQESTPSLMS